MTAEGKNPTARTFLLDRQSVVEILREHIGQSALEFAEDLLEATERDALGTLLQAVQGGRRETKLPGKLRERHSSALLFQEAGKLALQGRGHATDIGK